MFSHFLAGELVFLFLGKYFGFDISAKFLILGSFCGFFPDILSHILSKGVIKKNKWYHKHRDNFSHSLFLPVLIFCLLFFLVDISLALIILIAMLTHPFLDLWGIGWGVKLFFPFSDSVFKLFYKKKILYIFKNEKEREKDVRKYGRDNWFKVAYFFSEPSGWLKWWGIFEWLSLILAIFLIVFYISY